MQKIKPILFACLILAMSGVAQAQEKGCLLSHDQLPEVRGFKLGMAAAQIKRRFPNFAAPEPDEFGYAEFEYDFTLERGAFESDGLGGERREPLDGIDRKGLAAVRLGFMDGRLISFAVSYDSSVTWAGVGEFLEVVIPPLRLPARRHWKPVDDFTMELRCADSLVRATIMPTGGGSSLGFFKLGVRAEIDKRKVEKATRTLKDFRP
jgi:hypothetical protein